MNNNRNISIDYAWVARTIHTKAQELRKDIREENYYAFVEGVKGIAKDVLEDYCLKNNDLYYSGTLKIQDARKMNKFIDFHDGYLAKMKTWAREKEIRFKAIPVTQSSKTKRGKYIMPLTILILGTAVVICIALFTKKWILLILELLPFCIVFAAHKKAHRDFVRGIISDIEDWLGKAEGYSDCLLKSFDL